MYITCTVCMIGLKGYGYSKGICKYNPSIHFLPTAPPSGLRPRSLGFASSPSLLSTTNQPSLLVPSRLRSQSVTVGVLEWSSSVKGLGGGVVFADTLSLVGLYALGLILGSFAIALVWRMHAQEDIREKLAVIASKSKSGNGKGKASRAQAKKVKALQAELRGLSIASGRSMCSNCHHPLASQDLIPLFSWLWLRGKCRYCHQPIQDTPWIEALLPVAFVVSYLFWPLPLTGYGFVAFGFWLAFLVAFAALTVYDIRWYLLPDRIVWPLAGLATIQVLLHALAFDGGVAVLADAFWGVVVASGIFYVLYVLSKGAWIGGGDVKLGIVLGLLVGGPMNGLMLLFIASLLGILVSLPQIVRHRLTRTSVIPFGPFLMLAAFCIVLFGQRFEEWFNSYMLVLLTLRA